MQSLSLLFLAKVTLPPLICKQMDTKKIADSHEPAIPIIIYE